MENKINIAELLKDCPRGMELYSPMFGEVYLYKIRPSLGIVVTTSKEQVDFTEEFLYDGRYGINGECMLFPSRGRTTWEGFVPLCKFKDGDIVSTKDGDWIGITTGGKTGIFIPTYCVLKFNGEFEAYLSEKEAWSFHKLATEEEKQKLFNAIKENGYKWNAENKTLEKLTELVSDKFDINTLKPFDKVLVRDSDKDMWCASIFSHTWKDKYFCVGAWHNQCIPYEENKELLGTTDNCNEYYKTWNK